MSDLPDFTGVVSGGSHVDLMEAIGYGPTSEQKTSYVHLLGQDAHSPATATPQAFPLPKNSDGSPAYSTERWIRLRFSPPFGVVSSFRMWVDNFSPNPGWDVRFGTAAAYNTPINGPSTYAVMPLPTSDPGITYANVTSADVGLIGAQVQYTDWIVLQAVCVGVTGVIQAAPLNINFAWVES